MIFSLRKFIERLKFICLFIVLTMLFSYGYQYVSSWIEPEDRYARPQGQAIKAFEAQTYHAENYSVTDRLKFFYWYGE
jgi:hypothetical protein